MDLQDFDPFDVPAWPQGQHAVSEAPQTSPAAQDGFEQHLAEARQADPAPAGARDHYPHLSTEDRDLIDRAIAQYAAQKNLQPSTVSFYTQALRRLANDLRARGQTTDLENHASLLAHANAYFLKDTAMKTGVSILRAYHEPDHLVSRGRPRALPSAKNTSNDSQKSPVMDARARSNLLASEEVLINHEHDIAQSRAAKRPRTLNDLEEVVVYRQPSANAGSGGSSGATRVPSAGVLIRGQWDRRPLYPEDAADILRLEETLIQGGMTATSAKQHVNKLIGFSRWLFAKNRPGIVARLDSKSLSDGGDIHEFTQDRHKKILLAALEHLRTFRNSGAAIVHPRRAFTRRSPPSQNVTILGAQGPALVGPSRMEGEAAPHKASHEGHSPPEELQEDQGDQSARSAFVQELVASDPEQLPSEQLRRVLDYLDDQPTPSPVSVSSEDLQRLEKQLHDELHGLQDNQPVLSFPIDLEELTFSPEQLSPGELRRLLEDQNAQELVEGRADQPGTSAFIQEQVASDSEQLPQADLRVPDHLDDQPSPSPVSVPPEELQQMEKLA
ncbi:hypothetical protein LRP30_30840 [Bradyrhizobium sp. C-145]|uniref:hypothetical protein n=1 Tax=Bradyrhizobium sp. C-145 TaxID=574727 RepID=UPI00201B6236|nr:hypothetical protein [Bradyrhizobium sp. C-145]UQR61318.1 hypothetical protein LRP30_30840 [Bradyrhizobium sp. C-145]